MPSTVAICYGAIAAFVWLAVYAVGLALKDGLSLGRGIRLGFWNSLVMGVFWPVFVVALIVGCLYEAYMTFREV